MKKDTLLHIGVKRRSGRYPWGSGDDPYQHSINLLNYIKNCRKEGMKDSDIAKSLGMSTNEYRTSRSVAHSTKKSEDYSQAMKLLDKGYSQSAAARRMGYPEASFRYLIQKSTTEKHDILKATKERLKTEVDKNKYIDVGVGTESHMGISRFKLNTAVAELQKEGYIKHKIKTTQVLTNKPLWLNVLTPPETEWVEVAGNKHLIKTVEGYSEDGGRTFLGIQKPHSIDSNRVHVRYTEDGGADKDGLIEIRRNVPELSLNGKTYAQVRIAVDGTHYLKGMAIYSDDVPKGCDIIFNTNKDSSHSKHDTFKVMKDDSDNPFGSTIRQREYIDPKTGKKKLSALNLVSEGDKAREEGVYATWSNTLSSQFLSKQNVSFAKKQLALSFANKKEEYDEIMSYSNPTIRQKLLLSFADECDSAASHLKAASMPRQQNHVLIPVPSMKDNEVYAPNYKNGERVVLIRHPHGGKFEIPELAVNNRNKEAKKMLGSAMDAVGINKTVADRLSGADFDGDHVLVIPNDRGHIKTSRALHQLKNFDTKTHYGTTEEERKSGKIKLMKKGNVQSEMGGISNLITDMTIKGATQAELARAVKHSMVVIDAEKHKLNYMQSYHDQGIAQLKEKYQGGKNRGASTLISKSKATTYIDEVKQEIVKKDINPKTGEIIYEKTGRTYTDPKTGKVKKAQTTTTKMRTIKDAHKLSSGTTVEGVYADHANQLKALANKARLDYLDTPNLEYSRSANKIYKEQAKSLDAKLKTALENNPRERQAQLYAGYVSRAKIKENPDLDTEHKKKIRTQALEEGRSRMGAKKQRIEITPKEWEAIQAGAISDTQMRNIIKNTDLDTIKSYATPRTKKVLTPTKKDKAKHMKDLGYTNAEIASAVGVSVSTLNREFNQ